MVLNFERLDNFIYKTYYIDRFDLIVEYVSNDL